MENPSEPPGLLRVCPSCNSRIEPDHTFCEICGARMPELPACSNCGAQFIAPVKFCERCGTMVIPQGKPQPAADEITEPDHGPEPPLPTKPGVKKMVLAPPSSGRDSPGSIDDALFLLSDGRPKTVQQKTVTAPLVGGIVLLFIMLAGAYFIGLPLLTGSGGPGAPGTPADAAITPEPESATLLPTLTETPAPATVTGALAPQPTQLLPREEEVSFQVYKNPADAKITITFVGGPGYDSLINAEVKVTHPDGAVTSGVILPYKGAPEIILDGSEDTDRVEIIAKMTDGRTYRVFDELVAF